MSKIYTQSVLNEAMFVYVNIYVDIISYVIFLCFSKFIRLASLMVDIAVLVWQSLVQFSIRTQVCSNTDRFISCSESYRSYLSQTFKWTNTVKIVTTIYICLL